MIDTTLKIEDYINIIYKDFKEYVDNNRDNLCDFKKLNFECGNVPDYSEEHIQQLYLLRYAYSYAFEYKWMFSSLLKREKFDKNIEVTSIGCGNKIDYWSLVRALNKTGNNQCHIDYTGIDLVDWNYSFEKRTGDDFSFEPRDAAEFFKAGQELTSNVYIFPKSISEFPYKVFKTICDGFKNNKITKDKFHILISLREDTGSLLSDKKRSKQLAEAIVGRGDFITEDNIGLNRFIKKDKELITQWDSEFIYPNEPFHWIGKISDQCNKKETCKEYSDDLENSGCKVNRYPIKYIHHIKYQIFTFERKD